MKCDNMNMVRPCTSAQKDYKKVYSRFHLLFCFCIGVPQIVRGRRMHRGRLFRRPEEWPRQRPSYPTPLFACTDAQAQFITKKGVSGETIFDGVRRSNETCGYHTHFEEEKKINRNKLTGPGPRQQLKPCKVLLPPNNLCDPPALFI